MLSVCLLITLSLLLVLPIDAAEVALSPSPKVPYDPAHVVAKDFASFGIQASSFPFYAGNDTDGTVSLTQNLLDVLAERTGTSPQLRVGGTNGDEATYDPLQQEAVTSWHGSIVNASGIPSDIVLGPSFFEGFKHQRARWVFGIPFVGFNKTNTLVQAKQFLQNVDQSQVEALEVGNEPDLYRGRAKDAVEPPRNYVSKWHEYTKLLSDNLALPNPARPWQGLVLARAEGHDSLTIPKIFSAGINSSNDIASVSTHYYQHTNSTGPLSGATLLNHTNITEGLQPYDAVIQWLKVNSSGLDLILGETGRYPVNRKKYPAGPADGNFGTALWTVDMMLYATTIGIARINMQLGITMSYTAWHPIDAKTWKRDVRAPFYAHVFIADAIGRDDDTTVHELPRAKADHHSAYGIYNAGLLQRIAIVNLERYVASSSTSSEVSTDDAQVQRPFRTYKLNLTDDIDSVTISKLSGPDAEVLSGFSYGGKQWLIENDGKTSNAQTDDTVTKSVENGTVSVDVDASQAVLIQLHRRSGETQNNDAAHTIRRREL